MTTSDQFKITDVETKGVQCVICYGKDYSRPRNDDDNADKFEEICNGTPSIKVPSFSANATDPLLLRKKLLSHMKSIKNKEGAPIPYFQVGESKIAAFYHIESKTFLGIGIPPSFTIQKYVSIIDENNKKRKDPTPSPIDANDEKGEDATTPQKKKQKSGKEEADDESDDDVAMTDAQQQSQTIINNNAKKREEAEEKKKAKDAADALIKAKSDKAEAEIKKARTEKKAARVKEKAEMEEKKKITDKKQAKIAAIASVKQSDPSSSSSSSNSSSSSSSNSSSSSSSNSSSSSSSNSSSSGPSTMVTKDSDSDSGSGSDSGSDSDSDDEEQHPLEAFCMNGDGKQPSPGEVIDLLQRVIGCAEEFKDVGSATPCTTHIVTSLLRPPPVYHRGDFKRSIDKMKKSLVSDCHDGHKALHAAMTSPHVVDSKDSMQVLAGITQALTAYANAVAYGGRRHPILADDDAGTIDNNDDDDYEDSEDEEEDEEEEE
jgi:hypothetical protein